MLMLRRWAALVLAVVIGIVIAGVAASKAVVRLRGSSGDAGQPLSEAPRTGPKAVVDQPKWDLGIIESAEEFHHTFIIRNEGQTPLQLAPGPTSCKCMVGGVPEEPVPPGDRAEAHVRLSQSAMKEELKSGDVSRGFKVLTNDAEHESIVLVLTAKVRRRLAAAPSPITLSIHSPEALSEQKRSAAAVVYSQRWDRFELSVLKASLERMKWRVEPATQEALSSWERREVDKAGVLLLVIGNQVARQSQPAGAGTIPKEFDDLRRPSTPASSCHPPSPRPPWRLSRSKAAPLFWEHRRRIADIHTK